MVQVAFGVEAVLDRAHGALRQNLWEKKKCGTVENGSLVCTSNARSRLFDHLAQNEANCILRVAKE